MRAERPRSGQSKRLGIERLENRELMAGNVTAAVQGGFLVVTGDTADNGVTIDYIQATNSYQVIGTTPSGGTATTINGLDTSVPANAQIFTNVTKGLKVTLNAGNDNLVFGAATSSTFVVVGTSRGSPRAPRRSCATLRGLGRPAAQPPAASTIHARPPGCRQP